MPFIGILQFVAFFLGVFAKLLNNIFWLSAVNRLFSFAYTFKYEILTFKKHKNFSFVFKSQEFRVNFAKTQTWLIFWLCKWMLTRQRVFSFIQFSSMVIKTCEISVSYLITLCSSRRLNNFTFCVEELSLISLICFSFLKKWYATRKPLWITSKRAIKIDFLNYF